MDDLDERLLLALRENARRSVTDLARRLGVARTTIQARIERLERRGVVRGYTVRMGEDPGRERVRALVMIKVPSRHAAAAERALREYPEVTCLQSLSGEYDMVAVVSAPDMSRLDTCLDAIGLLEGVERTLSSIILATKFDR